MKQIQALVAAIVVTAVIGLGMLAIGVNAALNTNTVPVNDSPPSVSAAANDSQISAQDSGNLVAQYQDREKQYQTQLSQANAKIQQLNSLVTQYQDREKQYQAQLSQANAQAQGLQNILNELQRRGIIRINSDGTIQIRVGARE